MHEYTIAKKEIPSLALIRTLVGRALSRVWSPRFGAHRGGVRGVSEADASTVIPRGKGRGLAPIGTSKVLTARRNGVLSSTSQVGKAGQRPALPRNCGGRRNRAAPSQTTDGVDGAGWTFAGEGGFRRVRTHPLDARGPAAHIPRRQTAAGS